MREHRSRRPMARTLGIAWFAGIVTGGTLLGHAVAYALEGRSLADGHHGYFAPLADVAVASALLGCALVAGRAIASRGVRHHALALPRLPQLWVGVASLQVAGFAGLERLEGNAPNALGCGIEILIALFVAIAMTLFGRVVEQLAQSIVSAYAPRLRAPCFATGRSAATVDAARALAVRVGVRRFKRPPPILG
jgi:hypothetical protein